jgi:hopanoid biosynthesis associated radical SAM protein HpnH
VGLPLSQTARIGAYVAKQHFTGRKRYPLVLMLEPLYRCNLACAGCGKIDYPDEILNQRLSFDECMAAIDECGAPAVSIAGGEPLLHRDMPRIVEGFIAKRKLVILCTNALLLTKKIDDYKPSPYLTWSIHLDGDQVMHDKSVCLDGVYEKAVEAIKLAKSKGFMVQINCTLFDGSDPKRVADFFDVMTEMGIDGITISPGYSYERAPDQEHFLNRTKHLRARRRGQEVGLHPVGPVPRLPGRQPDLSVHAVEHAAAHRVRLAKALLPARRRLCADLQGTDGRHRVGRLRRRQV